jgi:cyclic 2,3-diphosphoglycerate synthetase
VSRIVVLIDGEHYPPVVSAAIAALRADSDVAAAVFAGGSEKVGAPAAPEAYGVPVVRAASASEALRAAIEQYRPDAVVDLSDEPVVSSSDRFHLASVALRLGVAYRGADFHFDPPSRALVTRTPALSIVGTGKRVGKTAVSAHVARTLTSAGSRVVVLAMGRGGPEMPELIRGDEVALTTSDLLALARAGVHAASDNYEDAVMARVATVGCRRCGGGMAGSVFFSNVPEGALLADGLGMDLILLEGSGAAVPPVAADASLLVVGAAQGPGYVTEYFGPLRVATADAIIVAGAEDSPVSAALTSAIITAVREQQPGIPVVPVTFRPRAIAPIGGSRVFFATTAPSALLPTLVEHLERHHDCTVVASSPHLSDRARLRADLEQAKGTFDVLLTELKAAAVDVVVEAGDAAGVPVVLADNVPHATDGTDLEAMIRDLADLASQRGRGRVTADGS